MNHIWISTDTDENDACLVCGGMWVENGHSSIGGDPATDCTRNTTQCHHFHGECSNYPDVACQIDRECNCLLCYS